MLYRILLHIPTFLTDFALIGENWVSVGVKIGGWQSIVEAASASHQLRRRVSQRLHLLHERHDPLELARLGSLGLVRLANLI